MCIRDSFRRDRRRRKHRQQPRSFLPRRVRRLRKFVRFAQNPARYLSLIHIYAKAADGSPVLVMVSKSESIAGDKPANKEQSMSEENKKYAPYTTEHKKEYAKQFTPNEIKSYRKGQRLTLIHI